MNTNKYISPFVGLTLVIILSVILGWCLNNSVASLESQSVPTSVIQKDNTSSQIEVNKCVDEKGKDISGNLSTIASEIAKKETCDTASDLAESCAWGSTADIQITASASRVCSMELEKNKPSQKLKSILTDLVSACHEKYKEMQGTMYVSLDHYCALSALRLVTDISDREEF